MPCARCRPTAWVLLPLALLVAGACSSIKVSSDYPAGTDFASYRTFSIMTAAELEQRFGASPLTAEQQRRVQDAISDALLARGLSRADAAPADLSVAYRTGRSAALDPSTYGRIYTYQGTTAEPTYARKEIEEGMLLVDLLDVRTGELVWRGEARGKPDPNRIEDAATKILSQYPPGR